MTKLRQREELQAAIEELNAVVVEGVPDQRSWMHRMGRRTVAIITGTRPRLAFATDNEGAPADMLANLDFSQNLNQVIMGEKDRESISRVSWEFNEDKYNVETQRLEEHCFGIVYIDPFKSYEGQKTAHVVEQIAATGTKVHRIWSEWVRDPATQRKRPRLFAETYEYDSSGEFVGAKTSEDAASFVRKITNLSKTPTEGSLLIERYATNTPKMRPGSEKERKYFQFVSDMGRFRR